MSSVAFLIDLTHRGRSIRADREQRAGESRQRKGRSRSGGSGSHTHQLDIGTVCSVRRSKKVHTRAPRLRQRVATPHHQARSSWAYGRTTCPSCSRSACSCARCAVKLVATGITRALCKDDRPTEYILKCSKKPNNAATAVQPELVENDPQDCPSLISTDDTVSYLDDTRVDTLVDIE